MTDTVSDQPRKIWFRLAQVGAAFGLLLLLFLDVYFGSFRGSDAAHALAGLVAVGSAALVWLVAHRLGPVALPLIAAAVAGWSLLLTLSMYAADLDSGVFAFAETAALLGLLLVVVRRSHRWLVALGGGALVTAIGAEPLRSGLGDSSVILGLLFVLIAASVAATGGYLRTLDSGRRRQVQLVRAEQRAELARDLHDFVAHHVTGIVVQAQGARIIAAQDPERVVAALEQIERAGAVAMASMRRMVGVLRAVDSEPDAPVAPLAGIAELAPLVDGFTAAGPIAARLHIEGHLDDLPVEVTSSAYRVVMESLSNDCKHAHRAARVDVVLHRIPDWLLVRVADDGHSGLPRGGPGFGLIGLNERVAALGGRIQAGPGAAGGWVVEAALPLGRVPMRQLRQ